MLINWYVLQQMFWKLYVAIYLFIYHVIQWQYQTQITTSSVYLLSVSQQKMFLRNESIMKASQATFCECWYRDGRTWKVHEGCCTWPAFTIECSLIVRKASFWNVMNTTINNYPGVACANDTEEEIQSTFPWSNKCCQFYDM